MSMAVAETRPRKRARSGRSQDVNIEKGVVAPSVNKEKKKVEKTQTLEIHDCSFVKWNVRGVSAVAASQCGRYIATARSNGDIELKQRGVSWMTTSISYAESGETDVSITGLEFTRCSRYLFAVRLNGTFTMFRVTGDGLIEHTMLTPGGGAIWDLAVCEDDPDGNQRIAIACDDGRIRIIRPDLSYGGEQADSSLPKNPSHYDIKISQRTAARVLCVSWAPASLAGCDGCVVCGDSKGGLRWVNASSGTCYGRGKIPMLRRQEVAIWTLKFVRDGRQVICGDSRGCATVWSSISYTMSEELRIEGLEGDIWSSTVAREDNLEVVVLGSANGGVGGLKSNGEDDFWAPLRGTRLHTHDVRGLACFPDGCVISGSTDSLLRTFKPSALVKKSQIQWIRPVDGCVGQPSVQFFAGRSIIIAKAEKSLDIWSLPNDMSPMLRLRMKLDSFSSGIRACSISMDDTVLAVSTAEAFRIYQVWDGCGNFATSSSFGKVRLLDVDPKVENTLMGCVDMTFCGEVLVCVGKCKKRIFLFVEGEIRELSTSEILGCDAAITGVASSSEHLAVCDSRGNVFLQKVKGIDTGKSSSTWQQVVTSSESSPSLITAMSFSISGKKIAVLSSDLHANIVMLSKAKVSSRVLDGRLQNLGRSVSFSWKEDSLLVSGEKQCAVVPIQEKTLKRKRSSHSKPHLTAHVLRFEDCILASCVLGSSRIAVVRRKWDDVIASLPDAMPMKVFGT